MHFDAVIVPHIMPVHATETGSPLLQRETIPFGAIMPPPILPEENVKTGDRNAKPERPEEDEEDENPINQLPPEFRLIFARDFATILKYLSIEKHGEIFKMIQDFKDVRGVGKYRGYPDYYVNTPTKALSISGMYEETLFYHYTRPGNRFIGRM